MINMRLGNWLMAIASIFAVEYVLLVKPPIKNPFLVIPISLLVGYSWLCAGSDHEQIT